MLEVNSQLTVWNDLKQSNENPGTVHGAGFDCRTGRVYAFEGASTDGMWNKVSQNVNVFVVTLKVCQYRRGDDILGRMGFGKVMIVSVQFYLIIICTFTCS